MCHSTIVSFVLNLIKIVFAKYFCLIYTSSIFADISKLDGKWHFSRFKWFFKVFIFILCSDQHLLVFQH